MKFSIEDCLIMIKALLVSQSRAETLKEAANIQRLIRYFDNELQKYNDITKGSK